MYPFIVHLVSTYSLVALVVGTFFEGEAVLLTAGVFVSQHKLDAVTVWLLAAAGAWLGHLFWFGLGSWIGSQGFIRRFPKWEKGILQADEVVRQRPWISIFLLQYMYGMRMIGALALGFSSLAFGWFAFAEAINCLVWAALIGGIGYAIGESAIYVIEWSSRGFWVLALLVSFLLLYRRFQRKQSKT